jgi:hypothetical protein
MPYWIASSCSKDKKSNRQKLNTCDTALFKPYDVLCVRILYEVIFRRISNLKGMYKSHVLCPSLSSWPPNKSFALFFSLNGSQIEDGLHIFVIFHFFATYAQHKHVVSVFFLHSIFCELSDSNRWVWSS